MSYLHQAIYIFNVFIFIYVLFVDAFYLLFFILSLKQLRKYMNRITYSELDEISTSQLAPPISIIVPSYNEEITIKDSVLSFLNLDYPEYEVIVINDGSKDKTLDTLIKHFDLIPVNNAIREQIKTKEIRKVYRSVRHPYLIVIDKENGGKADALNTGINFSNFPYFCGVDADSLLEQDALLKTMSPFFEGAEDIVACGGIVRIANGCKIIDGKILEIGLPKSKLALHQVIEYLRSFLMGRLGLSSINSLLIISGAFGIFRKREVIEIGGYNTKTVGEDMELVVRLQKYLYDTNHKGKVLFIPDPVCWTEAPENFKDLYLQRKRWNQGLFESLKIHRRIIFNPSYKLMGLIAMPYFLFVELLGPPIELLGYIFLGVGLYLGVINIPFAILFGIATLLFGIFLSIGAVLLEEWSLRRYPKVKELLKLVFYGIIENFWYRQLNAFWKTISIFTFFKREKSWGRMQRRGFTTKSTKDLKS